MRKIKKIERNIEDEFESIGTTSKQLSTHKDSQETLNQNNFLLPKGNRKKLFFKKENFFKKKTIVNTQSTTTITNILPSITINYQPEAIKQVAKVENDTIEQNEKNENSQTNISQLRSILKDFTQRKKPRDLPRLSHAKDNQKDKDIIDQKIKFENLKKKRLSKITLPQGNLYQKAKLRKSIYLGGAENGFLGNVMILEEDENKKRRGTRNLQIQGTNAEAYNDLAEAIQLLSGTDPNSKMVKQDLTKRKKCLIEYNGNFKTIWEVINSILVFYIFFVLPIRISFSSSSHFLWETIDIFIDITFFVDLILKFFTPIYKGYELICDRKIIILTYLKTYFIIDLISIIPLRYIVVNYPLAKHSNKFLRFYRVFEVKKTLFRISQRKSNPLLVKWIIKLISVKSVTFNTLFPTFFLIFLVSHLASCLWHYFSFFSKYQDTWLDRQQYRDRSAMARYIYSFYFVYQTITTVGYGDVGVKTPVELIFTICLMFVGVVFYSTILTKLLGIISEANEQHYEGEQKVEMLKGIAQQIKIPGDIMASMYRAIKEQLVDSNNNNQFVKDSIPEFKGVNKEDVFELLYEAYFWKLKNSRFIDSLVKDGYKEFVVSFGANMVKRTYRAGQTVYLKGDTPEYFYIMERGDASFVFPKFGNNKNCREDLIIMKDSFFGEQELLLDTKKRNYTCVAKTDLSCFIISSVDFLNILQISDFDLREHFERLSIQRQKLIIEVLGVYTKCWGSATHEIEEAKLKCPLYRLRKILVSRKFRQMYIENESYFNNIRFTSKLNLTKLKDFADQERKTLLRVKKLKDLEEGVTLNSEEDLLTIEEHDQLKVILEKLDQLNSEENETLL